VKGNDGRVIGEHDLMSENIEGVHLKDLPPFTTLLVRTVNSLYRVVVIQGTEVYVQGGSFFPDPTSACLDGASIGGRSIRVGWIGIDLLVEIRAAGRRVITSPVRAITVERTSLSVVQACCPARYARRTLREE
jgi:hypothetical protein